MRVHPGRGERLAGRRFLGHRQGEQQALDGDKAIAGLLGDLLGLLENPGQLRAHIDLAGTAALYLGLAAKLGFDSHQCGLRIAAGGVDQVGAEAFLVVEEDFEQVLGRQPLMAATQRQVLRGLDKSFRPLGIFFKFHRTNLR